MSSGDDALWNHADGSRGPRVFDGALGGATCVGKFRRIDWYVIDAPETGASPIRKVRMCPAARGRGTGWTPRQ